MRKYKYALILVIASIVVIGLTTIVLFNIKKSDTQKGSQIAVNTVNNENKIFSVGNEEKVVITNSNGEEKISPNAIIIFNKYYKQCNHTIIDRENITNEMVNLTQEEFKNLYSDWQIKSFASNQITLYKEFEGECGEHYVVKAENGSIVIYKITSNDELELIEDTEISTQYLPQIDLDNLNQGVTLVGKEELNAYIENFE